MSHENERKHTNEDRGTLDLSFIIQQHEKEIWEWKTRESEFIQTKNLLDGSKRIIADMSHQAIEHIRIIAELEKEIERLVAENKK